MNLQAFMKWKTVFDGRIKGGMLSECLELFLILFSLESACTLVQHLKCLRLTSSDWKMLHWEVPDLFWLWKKQIHYCLQIPFPLPPVVDGKKLPGSRVST